MIDSKSAVPERQGLYDPAFEHDACGIGFVVRVNGERSHQVVTDALQVLVSLSHRGGAGSEDGTGDGAGILMQIPDRFFRRVCPDAGITLPPPGDYGVGMVFMPRDPVIREECRRMIDRIVAEEGQTVLGWRVPPVNDSALGSKARSSRPSVRQILIAKSAGLPDAAAFERKLYVIRRRCEKLVRDLAETSSNYFYFASLSSRTIVYKGMLTAGQVDGFYLDLRDFDVESALALVHSRYSTNTFPSWERAHPYRYLIHNGEINTLRGNVNWMKARESTLQPGLFGPDLGKILPLIQEEGSDSAIFDNCLEFLHLSGRSLPHSAMMMVPEPWENNEGMSSELKAFYEYHSTLMEPWDGPAAMAFTDGIRVGALLDRNGLRPSRYTVTSDGLVILSSETGVLDIRPDRILRRGRLLPGRMLLIDTQAGQIIDDAALKGEMACARPYGEWLGRNMFRLDDPEGSDAEIPAVVKHDTADPAVVKHDTADPAVVKHDAADPAVVKHDTALTLEQKEKIFGYTYEDLRLAVLPMASDGEEPIGSMGTDTPLAVLSKEPQTLYAYFKQMFAQVTNPPIDAIRESIVTSTFVYLGPEGSLTGSGTEDCPVLRLDSPVIPDSDLRRIRGLDIPGLTSATLDILFPAGSGRTGLHRALNHLFNEADAAIRRGTSILILSDRGVSVSRAAIPALLAVSGLHHHLIRSGTRTRVSLVLESGEPREVHHFALLLGYGVSAVNPWLALEIAGDSARSGRLEDRSVHEAQKNYLKAAVKGIVKILSKMGISTIQSYQGSQIFEAVGIGRAAVDEYFTATPSRIGGIGLEEIAAMAGHSHAAAFAGPEADPGLPSGGHVQWRSDGEYHMYNPMTVHLLQQACRNGDYTQFRAYSDLLNDETRPVTLRGLLEFVPSETPVPLDEVEPVEKILRRFKTGAMSYGSISREAHEALAIAMNRLGGKSNTGEGGEDPERFRPLPNGDSRCSAIKQVASGRFGVTGHYLVNAEELQIKIAQGAKPGEGGQLPGRKVYPWIAATRHATPGVGLISPPPHHDIYSIEDLAELIYDLKNANDKARVSVKLVSEAGVGTVAAGVAKGRADVVLISGYDGGTGASPRTSIRHAGLPWELGLAETHQTLLLNDLRSRITVETDGKLMTGRDVAVAALLGAEEFGFATGPLVALGCIMMRVCNLDTCPMGIATQNPQLRERFAGKPEHVEHFMRFIARELREIMAMLGFRTVSEMVGRTDRLRQSARMPCLDLSPLLHRPHADPPSSACCTQEQSHGLDLTMDRRLLIPICRPAVERGRSVRAVLPIRNTDRVTGTLLGSEISRRYGAEGLPDGTISLRFVGSAGQSFGAFIPKGMTLTLEGDANDYIGKGLSGGRIIVMPPRDAAFVPEENIIAGNVALYGATGGECFIRGLAGERFCVRNSGAVAVAEGVGDHGCEYMTGGLAIVLGRTGRNFAAGMSGGIAYVYDEDGRFLERCNTGMVRLSGLPDTEDEAAVLGWIREHADRTGSDKARKILENWQVSRGRFIKVMPMDYQRMLDAIAAAEADGLSGDAALLAAFESSTLGAARSAARSVRS